ncbi:hypothetical protein FRB90_009911 [Tulasnella sp. 427]|nr:hypothetical protein FRB90_009911 [Tulasnella sp. 427]
MGDKTLVNGKFNSSLPLFGPRFLPPPPAILHRNPVSSDVSPEEFYLKPVTIIHELFWPWLKRCPTCEREGRREFKMERQGFTPEGPRTVHGLYEDEYVIGSRVRCKVCEGEKPDRVQWSFTAQEFWNGKSYWEIPPISRDLFNLIIELRLSVPADKLREHVFQLHLLEYHQRHLQYLQLITARTGLKPGDSQQPHLDQFFTTQSSYTIKPFSEPCDPKGFNLTSISDDVITSVYAHFASSRVEESEELMRGITGKVLSFDATYKATKKATISNGKTNEPRQKPFETLVSIITEDNLIASWRFTFTETMSEIQAQLRDLSRRYNALDCPLPLQIVVDNCCTVRNKVLEVLPNAAVGQDVYHYSVRYTRAMKSGQPDIVSTVGKEIVSALLSATAETSPTGRAQYRRKEEQAKLMEECFRKWKSKGVFTSAVDAVHEAGMKHLRKGCLERCVEDVRSDGSRIENTNRGWNSIARAVPGGLEGFLNQAHDWVLRRNIRLAFKSKTITPLSAFVATTFGSHQISLVSKCTDTWNMIIKKRNLSYPLLETLRSAKIDEHFGLVRPIDGTLGVNSTADIDYIGFEETLLLEDVVKRELGDDYLSSEVAEDIPSASAELPPTQGSSLNPPASLKRGHPSERNGSLPSNKRARSQRNLDVKESDDVAMELIPYGQDIKEYLRPQPLSEAPPVLPSPPLHDPRTSHPSGHGMPKAQHPFFDRFPRPFQTPDASSSRQSTPLITPRVLLRPPAKITRHVPSRSPSTALHVQSHQTDQIPASLHVESPAHALPEDQPWTSAPPTTPMQPQVPHTQDKVVPGVASSSKQTALSPTQQTFQRLTKIDPTALKFQKDDFFIMMDLRAERKWDSRKMVQTQWEDAVQVFNQARQEKHPSRALVPLQGNVFQKELLAAEKSVSLRLSSHNYKARSGDETFWRKHCFAVPGFGPEGLVFEEAGSVPVEVAESSKANDKHDVTRNKDGSLRKTQVCRRCNQAKYPGGSTNTLINHKKSACSDGVSPTLKNVPFPLPVGVIKNKTLDLDMLRQSCSNIRQKQANRQALSLEEEAFLLYYSTNLVESPEGHVYWAIDEVSIPPHCPIVQVNNRQSQPAIYDPRLADLLHELRDITGNPDTDFKDYLESWLQGSGCLSPKILRTQIAQGFFPPQFTEEDILKPAFRVATFYEVATSSHRYVSGATAKVTFVNYNDACYDSNPTSRSLNIAQGVIHSSSYFHQVYIPASALIRRLTPGYVPPEGAHASIAASIEWFFTFGFANAVGKFTNV